MITGQEFVLQDPATQLDLCVDGRTGKGGRPPSAQQLMGLKTWQGSISLVSLTNSIAFKKIISSFFVVLNFSNSSMHDPSITPMEMAELKIHTIIFFALIFHAEKYLKYFSYGQFRN